ncbi:Cytochrome c [Shimia gijangensis]|uniref:Cytochrome c n=1 Tax=Shimia gijangensis TaxID=1470563 RepID=A0A1M6BIK7_9RHOB|nr:cytochrome c [Shimia gijangensis]SHI48497.1 Cytochrome c [Shimia gijangensis]
MKKIGLIIVAALGVGILTPVIVQSGGKGFLPYESRASIKNGQEIYEQQCASCHGAQLEGAKNWREPDEEGMAQAPPHDESGHTWHHPDMQLFQITKYGTAKIVGQGYKSNMPGFEDVLSDQDIVDVLAYIKSTWSKKIIEMHNQRNG